MSALSPTSMQGRGMLMKPLVWDNNGALQVRLRLDGQAFSSTASVALKIQLPKPGVKPSVPRSGGIRTREIWACP